MSTLLAQIMPGPQVLAGARACDLDAMTPGELAEATSVVQAVLREAQALNLALLAAADRKNAHKATGAPSLTALVAQEAGVSRKEAAQQVRLATRLETAPVLRAAIAQPGMSASKARIVTGALDGLPADLSRADRDRVEADLTAAAQTMSAEQLRLKAHRAIEVIDRERADRLENNRLERDEHAQQVQSEFWIAATPDENTGLVAFGGKTDPVSADMLRAVIDSKTSPRRRALVAADNSVEVVSTSSTTGNAAEPDENERLTPSQKAGEAFTEIIRHLPRDCYGNHGGVAATLVVTVDETTLRGQTDRAGVTEYGTRVSAQQLRRLACDAGILPAVMNGTSQVLDQGRTKRHHTAAQRIALAQRDHGCAYPGCDRPPGWTEAHHAIAWSHDGHTNIDTGVLLCAHHHRHVHNADIAIRFAAHDRMPEFLLHGRWQRNQRYRPLTA